MNASFEEKSVWIQLISLVVILGGYFVMAARLLASGVMALPAYASLFMIAVVLLVIVLVAGHTVVAIASRPEGRDERDRVISWRAENNSGWILACGVLFALTGLVVGIANAWVANLLMFSLLLSEVTKLGLQLFYYRRGMAP